MKPRGLESFTEIGKTRAHCAYNLGALLNPIEIEGAVQMKQADVARGEQPEWFIRPACPEDVRRLAILTDQLGYAVGDVHVERALQTILAREDHALYVAEIPTGQVVGWVHIFHRPLVMDPNSAELGGLIVDEAHRGQGIGRALLMVAEKWAVEREFSPLTIRSNRTRTRAKDFYLSLQYELRKISNTFIKILVEPG
jgi:GNAT superfamily N-acetyltransferase